jgi:hypothetical protein
MPTNPLSDPNWAPQVADTIERVVGEVRDRTTRPIIIAARGLVFGLLAFIVGIFALTTLIVGLLRGVQAILEWPFSHPTAVWLSYFIVGGLFCGAGVFFMVKRNPREAL